jgi:hypothetical protein
MQKGELTVTGHDYAVIPLRGAPSKVAAHFKDHETLVPCNPHHHDELECEAHANNGSFVLTISWRVTGVREIVWTVFY